jgi:hypothetical protein
LAIATTASSREIPGRWAMVDGRWALTLFREWQMANSE